MGIAVQWMEDGESPTDNASWQYSSKWVMSIAVQDCREMVVKARKR